MTRSGGVEYLEQPELEADIYQEMHDHMLTYGGYTASVGDLAALCPKDVSLMAKEDRNNWLVEKMNMMGAMVPAHLEATFAAVSERRGLEPSYKIAEPDVEPLARPDLEPKAIPHEQPVSLYKTAEQFDAPALLSTPLISLLEEQRRIHDLVQNEQGFSTAAVGLPEEKSAPVPIIIGEASALLEEAPSPAEINPAPFAATLVHEEVQIQLSPLETNVVEPERMAKTPLVLELPAPLAIDSLDASREYHVEPVLQDTDEVAIAAETLEATVHEQPLIMEQAAPVAATVLLEAISQRPEQTLTSVTAALEFYLQQTEESEPAPVAPIAYELANSLQQLDETTLEIAAPIMQDLLGAIHGMECMVQNGGSAEEVEAVQKQVEVLCEQLLKILDVPYSPADILDLIELFTAPSFVEALQLTMNVENVGTHELKHFRDLLQSTTRQADNRLRNLLGKIALLPHLNPLMVR